MHGLQGNTKRIGDLFAFFTVKIESTLATNRFQTGENQHCIRLATMDNKQLSSLFDVSSAIALQLSQILTYHADQFE